MQLTVPIHTDLIEQQRETSGPTDDFTTSCSPVLHHICLPPSLDTRALCYWLSRSSYQEVDRNIYRYRKKHNKNNAAKRVIVVEEIHQMVFMSVCGTCVYLWMQSFCGYEITPRQPQTSTDNCLHVAVLSGSLFHNAEWRGARKTKRTRYETRQKVCERRSGASAVIQ